jgi:hypothetical protein
VEVDGGVPDGFDRIAFAKPESRENRTSTNKGGTKRPLHGASAPEESRRCPITATRVIANSGVCRVDQAAIVGTVDNQNFSPPPGLGKPALAPFNEFNNGDFFVQGAEPLAHWFCYDRGVIAAMAWIRPRSNAHLLW